MTLPLTLTADQVASEIFQMSADWFLRARGQLERDSGFPPPLALPAARRAAPLCERSRGRPRLRWNRDAVLAWLATAHEAEPDTPKATNDNGPHRQRLEHRL